MSPMDHSAYPGIAFANPDAATALATGALVDVTNSLVLVTIALVVVALVVGLAQVAVVWHGINQMSQATRTRAAEQDQRHKEAMTALHALIRKNRPTRRAAIRPSP